jgi:hypothetical protein
MRQIAWFGTLLAAGCSIRVYHGLTETRAMRTCNAERSYQAQAQGHDEPSARDAAIRAARRIVRRDRGCGLLVTRQGYDATRRVGIVNFQLCECR